MLQRPLLVTVAALLTTLLGLWYLYAVARSLFVLGTEVVFGGSGNLPLDVQLGPLVVAGASAVIAILGLRTAGALRQGANWARFAAVLLSLFALPFGYPIDLVVAGGFVLVLFVVPGIPSYFRSH